jgi:hypothetical protein
MGYLLTLKSRFQLLIRIGFVYSGVYADFIFGDIKAKVSPNVPTLLKQTCVARRNVLTSSLSDEICILQFGYMEAIILAHGLEIVSVIIIIFFIGQSSMTRL